MELDGELSQQCQQALGQQDNTFFLLYVKLTFNCFADPLLVGEVEYKWSLCLDGKLNREGRQKAHRSDR
jgi:hypothetical protein